MGEILRLQNLNIKKSEMENTPLSTNSIICKVESSYSLFTCPISPES